MFVCLYVCIFVLHAFVRMRGPRGQASCMKRAAGCCLSRARGYARLEGSGHDDQPACRGSQNNSDEQGERGEAETSCAGLHARPKDWAFQ